MRCFSTLALLLLALSAACASRSAWLTEVNRLAAQPLSCEQFDIATMQHAAHEYDSVGCGNAIRYVCQSGACSPSGETVPADNPGVAQLVNRVNETRSVLQGLAPVMTRECSGGETFAARLFIDERGGVTEVQTNPDRGNCVFRNTPTLPRGTGAMVLAIVFEADD